MVDAMLRKSVGVRLRGEARGHGTQAAVFGMSSMVWAEAPGASLPAHMWSSVVSSWAATPDAAWPAQEESVVLVRPTASSAAAGGLEARQRCGLSASAPGCNRASTLGVGARCVRCTSVGYHWVFAATIQQGGARCDAATSVWHHRGIPESNQGGSARRVGLSGPRPL